MKEVFEIALAILASLGGAGVIIGLIIKFTSDIIADKLSKKYQHLLDEKLEAHKFILDKKNYISKIRFDTEFAIYRSLSGKLLEMCYDTSMILPRLDELPRDPKEKEKVYQERYAKAAKIHNLASNEIMSNAPFIPAELYKKFEEIRLLCHMQLGRIGIFFGMMGGEPHDNSNYAERKEIYNKNEEIRQKQEVLIDDLREYLSKLDVYE